MVRVLLTVWLVSGVMSVSGTRVAAVTVDALMATVGSQIIMLSDVRLAEALQLFGAGLNQRMVLERLIERSLMLAEVDRFEPPEPLSASVDRATEALRLRVGPSTWAATLSRCGVDEGHVRALVRDNLRLDAYLLQRFGALADPTDEEISTAASASGRPDAASLADDLRAAETRVQLREQLRATRYATLTSQWLLELRTRNAVSVRPMLSATDGGPQVASP